MKEGKTNISGEAVHMPFWSWGPLQQAHSAAMREDADKAMEKLRVSLTTLMDFGALNESAQTDLSDVHHPWFNTAAGAYARALTRMLVYPREHEMLLLPGIPDGWREFSFTLPIYGGGAVSVQVRAGVIARLAIREGKAGTRRRRIHVPKRYLPENPAFAEGVTVREEEAKVILELDSVGEQVLCRTQ